MKILLMICVSFVFAACNKFDPSKISEKNPQKIQCFDDLGKLIFDGTVVNAKSDLSQKGFVLKDLNGKEVEINGSCKISEK